jgi:hypothetical protein
VFGVVDVEGLLSVESEALSDEGDGLGALFKAEEVEGDVV